MIDASGQEPTPAQSPMETPEPKTPPPHKPQPNQRNGPCAPHKYGARSRSSHPSVCGRQLRRYSL